MSLNSENRVESQDIVRWLLKKALNYHNLKLTECIL